MPQSFNGPVFHLGNAARVDDHGASVSTASRRAVMLRLSSSVSEASASFRKDHFAVRRMHLLIGRSVKNNGANATFSLLETPLPLRRRYGALCAAHGGKCRRLIGSGPIGEAGVNACRGVKFGIGGAHDLGHGAAS